MNSTAAASSRNASPFSVRVVVGMIVAGIVAFAALLLATAYGGTPASSGRDGRAHALSPSAIGYKGLVNLVGQFRETYLISEPNDFDTDNLVVVSLEEMSRPEELRRVLDQRHGRATLIILPKWATMADPTRRGWVRAVGPGAGAMAAPLLGEGIEVRVAPNRPAGAVARGVDFLTGQDLPVPRQPQFVRGKSLTVLVPLPGNDSGAALVARLGDQPHYVVADPDLLNNHGLRDPERARAALALIDALNATDAEGVDFDLTVNGLGTTQTATLLRLAFEPPFLAMTLALFAAAVLAGLHGAGRFGPVRREQRAIAFGKAALVENSAGLIRLAEREANLGHAYADVVRQEAARATAAPAWLQGDRLDAYLNRLGRGGGRTFSELAAELAQARDRHALMAAARALFAWRREIAR